MTSRVPPVSGESVEFDALATGASWLPTGLKWVDSGIPGTRPILFSDDAERSREFAPDRRRQHLNARWCAYQALRCLGAPATQSLAYRVDGPAWIRRSVEWPPGVVGSISHCPQLQAGCVADSHRIRSLGIDVELNRPLPDGVGELVLSEGEQRSVAALARQAPEIAWDRLVFSTKEAVFKAWCRHSSAWLAFDACRVRPQLDGSLHITADSNCAPVWPGLGRELVGRWARGLNGSVVVTLVAEDGPSGAGQRE